MALFYPTLRLRRITELTAGRLRGLDVRGLILDVDNTLTTADNPVPDPFVLGWLEQMKAQGIKMIILSNNNSQRVEPFAGRVGLPFLADAKKPLPGGLRRAARLLGEDAAQLAVVGDQIFTDVLGGNLIGAKTVLVEPMHMEPGRFFQLKRRLERGILRRCWKG